MESSQVARAMFTARLRQSPLYGKINSNAIARYKMPVNPSLYPDNWKELAMRVKVNQNWRCQCCGKKCYEPGERPDDLTRAEWTADILQVHHRNHNTMDNRLSNLLSVCAACHLDLHRGRYSSVSEGQLSLW